MICRQCAFDLRHVRMQSTWLGEAVRTLSAIDFGDHVFVTLTHADWCIEGVCPDAQNLH